MQAHITGLPQEVLATPLGQMLAPMLSPLEQQLGNIHQQPAGESGPASQTAQGNTVAAAAASRASPATSSQQVCEVVLPVYGKHGSRNKASAALLSFATMCKGHSLEALSYLGQYVPCLPQKVLYMNMFLELPGHV